MERDETVLNVYVTCINKYADFFFGAVKDACKKYLSKPRLRASILQSQPRALGASRLAQIFCRMDPGSRKAYGPT